jgi:phenol 2-monooxygenase
MQFHQDGFHPGDPRTAPEAKTTKDIADVLIVGAGPAGLTLAAYLAQFPDIDTRLIEVKPGPMQLGQADGVSCRSMEMFQVFGFANAVMEEAYWVNEAVFWTPDPTDPSQIRQSGRVQDVEDGLSEMPHTILNQARVHDMYLGVMRNAPTRMQPLYAHKVSDVTAGAPCEVQVETPDGPKTVLARYVVGCDGARSAVRRATGLELKGDSANKAWGVMDVLGVTDFPDIRKKALIQSASEGTVLVIPREGGHLVRLYVELESLGDTERVRDRDITLDDLIAAANRILAPYTLDVKEVPWWSVYEIGQRLTDRFQKGNVFIAGDACHTHSPKAGQGMNVSMGDGFNLAWKLAEVLRGEAPEALLETYSTERQSVAQDLIDFDRAFAKVIAAKGRDADAPELQSHLTKAGRYTAGMGVRYAPSVITGDGSHQALAQGFEIGTRFHSAPVIRVADAKRVELGHVIKPDGRWRLFAFVGSAGLDAFSAAAQGLSACCDLRAVLQEAHHDVDWAALPGLLKPPTGRYGLTDYERVFAPDLKTGPDIFDLRGVDRDQGALVLVRPDQYVADVQPLSAPNALVFVGSQRHKV